MLFSSITFLYYFLPILLLVYFIVPSKFKNLVLLIFSLIFYFYGEPVYIVILLLSCLVNYMGGIIIDKNNNNSKKLNLIIILIFNIALLFVFKYSNFFITNINNLFESKFGLLSLALPIGISFYTFQMISYIVDVYKGNVKANRNLINFATYVTLFPQLVAGPIVRYKDINKELKKRDTSYDDFACGVKRFSIGLLKKVLIANVIGELITSLTGLSEITVLSEWIKVICFTLQIYFDFSGYSDMAIGLGLMFGFHFLENFNYPLIASSITDFWRRWHISLSRFFKDYVYIPLGGNRVSKFKWFINIFIVWLLTGLWHGASWNFIIWGLYFGCLLVIEKLFLGKIIERTKIFKYIYTLFFVIISFAIFNDSFVTIKNILFLGNIPLFNKESLYFINSYLIILIISIILSTPIISKLINKINDTKFKTIFNILEPVFYILILVLVTSYLIDSSFNPFLYFRF